MPITIKASAFEKSSWLENTSLFKDSQIYFQRASKKIVPPKKVTQGRATPPHLSHLGTPPAFISSQKVSIFTGFAPQSENMSNKRRYIHFVHMASLKSPCALITMSSGRPHKNYISVSIKLCTGVYKVFQYFMKNH